MAKTCVLVLFLVVMFMLFSCAQKAVVSTFIVCQFNLRFSCCIFYPAMKILELFVIKYCAGILIPDVTDIDECQARVLIKCQAIEHLSDSLVDLAALRY